jgi:hypothetical protein
MVFESPLLDEPTKNNETVALTRGTNLSFRLSPAAFWSNLVSRRKKLVQTLGWGWAIVMELFRLLREITLWSHFYRGIENTCLDRAHEGRCGRRMRPA